MVVQHCYSRSMVPVGPCIALVRDQAAFCRLPIRFRGMGSVPGDGVDGL